ncbi:MAG: histidine kinase [Chitinophagales bacterium]|nr:histidine kinase [Chitinophagales bacterium]
MRKRLLSFLILLLSSGFLAAQYPYSKKVSIEEDNLTLKSTVLLKDHSGFLWIGTSEGLFKYNAVDPERIPLPVKEQKTHIASLFEDTKHVIWIGCRNGTILRFHNQEATAFTPPEGSPQVTINAIGEDARGRVWFATAGEGLYCYTGERLYNISRKDGLSDDNVNCLYIAEDNQVVAGTDRGISFIRFDKGKKDIRFITTRDGLSDNIVTVLNPARQKNRLLVGMQSKGILLFDLAKEAVADTSYKQNWRYGQVNDIIESKDHIYIATDGKGIIVFNKQSGNLHANNLLSPVDSGRVTDLQYDNEGNIWACSEGQLTSFTGDYLRYWYSVRNTQITNVHSILSDDEQKLWFTPDLGLFSGNLSADSNAFLRSYDITPPNDHIDITSLYKDRFGFLWIGTMGEGLFRLNTITGKWRRIAENPIAYYGNVLSIAGKDNQVWISTLNGVARFDLKENNYDLNEPIGFTNYSKKDGLGSDYVYAILIDKRNRVWFATDGAGVTMLDKGVFINFLAHNLFPSKVAYSLAEDSRQHIWISTYNDGLFEYDEKKFIRYNTRNGLADITITSIAVDDYDNIIAVNKKGIDVFNRQKNTVQHFGAESGFREQQPNLNSISKSPDGKVWIGTNKGIVCFDPNPSMSGFIPQAVIEQVLLFNQRIDTARQKTFRYDQNNFSFRIAAAYYKAPEKIRFQYWLEGYSKQWEVTGDRTISFAQLHPGRYLLKIRASASENFDSAPIATYGFTINRSFWTTWWFLTAMFVLTVVLVYWIVKQRIRKVRKEEQAQREQFRLQYDALKNQVNPHFLFNSFNALLNIVEENPKDAAQLIKHLSRFYRKMTAYNNKELISLAEEFELLNSYLFIQSKRFGSALQVSVHADADLMRNGLIPPLVLQLLAENAIKHNSISKENPIYINISTAGSGYLVMRNNIRPKLDKEESEGVGLQNIRNRYRLLTSKEVILENSGTEFVVWLPLLFAQ